jgi:hypothetical protein
MPHALTCGFLNTVSNLWVYFTVRSADEHREVIVESESPDLQEKEEMIHELETKMDEWYFSLLF